MNKKTGISLITLSLCLSLNGAELIKGDKDAAENESFSFNVNKNILSSNGNFYEGALTNITANQEYSLSRITRGAKAFTPLAPELVILKGAPDSINPLFGAGILELGLLETEEGLSTRDLPIVVTENRPATVYLIEDITTKNNSRLVASDDVHDAAGNVSPGIVGLTTNIVGHVFAAVKPNGGDFGNLNSGIALLIRGIQNNERVFGEIDAATGLGLIDPQSLRLDPTSSAIRINTDPTITPNIVSMHWDNSLQRLYIGLEVTASNTLDSGARAIAFVSFTGTGGIQLQTIAPDSAFDNGNANSIIGVRGANQQVSIHAIKTLFTSTALNYLIVVGGNGNSSSTQQSVFALPLVNTGDARGSIAQKNAQPQNVFKDAPVAQFLGRIISEPATSPDEMTQATDTAAQVGGGALLAGPIVNIITRDDTVFAFVGQNNSGVFSSQAIFDATGKITAWTAWQRAAGTTDNIYGSSLEAGNGTFILASGPTADTVKTVRRTIWSTGSETGLQPLTTILDGTFPPATGGIQGLETFLPSAFGLNNIAVLAAGGNGTVALAQTGTLNNNGILIPTPSTNFNPTAIFEDGIITADVNATTVTISGGALTPIGPITALEFGVNTVAGNTPNGWLFVGGSNGLAILAQQDGTGWNPLTELSNNLSGLNAGMRFAPVGDYTFVKKLIYDGDLINYNFLYVITHDRVDRINLNNSNFGTNTLDVVTIASQATDGVSNTGGFLDGIFSQACGIIATTAGLIRIGDNKDVRTITDESDANWTIVPIAENAGAPTALYTVTTQNQSQYITRNTGGYFYVLTADAGLNQSRINRFAVQPLGSTEPMNAQTIQPFDDLFVKNIPSFLLSFGEFRSNFATDGALYFATRNKNVDIPPVALLTPAFPAPQVGVKNVGDLSMFINTHAQNGTEINALQRSQASGSWVIAGDFNTQVLE